MEHYLMYGTYFTTSPPPYGFALPYLTLCMEPISQHITSKSAKNNTKTQGINITDNGTLPDIWNLFHNHLTSQSDKTNAKPQGIIITDN